MAKVISVKFKESGRAYYFNPEKNSYKIGDEIIVETANGIAFGTVSKANHEVSDELISKELKKVIRRADENDIKRLKDNEQKEKQAFKICEEKILSHRLDMKLTNVEYTFDASKIIFFFTSDNRVDFRELVKDLAAEFHTRIELRQIGVRDEARMLGGIGICGQPYCCKRFLDDFEPVSIKMAKEQGLSLNPTKISGSCGRLMCCLKYEQDSYEYLLKITPSVGSTVKTSEGPCTVIDANMITGNLIVKPNKEDGIPFKTNRKDVKLVSGKRKIFGKTQENNEDSE